MPPALATPAGWPLPPSPPPAPRAPDVLVRAASMWSSHMLAIGHWLTQIRHALGCAGTRGRQLHPPFAPPVGLERSMRAHRTHEQANRDPRRPTPHGRRHSHDTTVTLKLTQRLRPALVAPSSSTWVILEQATLLWQCASSPSWHCRHAHMVTSELLAQTPAAQMGRPMEPAARQATCPSPAPSAPILLSPERTSTQPMAKPS